MKTAESRVDVRRAGPDDAAVVFALVGEIAVHEGQSRHVTGSEEQWARMLGRPDVVVLVAERDGVPAGYVSAVRRLQLRAGADVLDLGDLFVREGFRHAGVGRLLMIELARFATAERLPFRWEMQPDDEGGQRFTRRLGATLSTKLIATWTPEQQEEFLRSLSL